MPGTALTMKAPDGMSKKIAKELAKEATEMFKNTDDVESVKRYLVSWGFESTKTYDVTIGGNL